ncbi:MAG TPA: ribosome silencing factor [Bryobacteraceae bacterium]|nr:ribosome silencing factor [Bryobacteraceae bacterium]
MPLARRSDKTRLLYSTITVGGRFLSRTDTTINSSRTEAETEDIEEPNWLIAARAAESKKASDIKVLDLTGITTFTDYFVLCNGTNARQMQAITDEIALQLKKRGERPVSVEGYDQGEWVLSDYSDLIVHVFSEKARQFYDLDRLWRQGKIVEIQPG